jgi:hypothetical protein
MSYTIEWKNRTIEDIISQVRALLFKDKSEYIGINIYDRYIVLKRDAVKPFLHGLEVGAFIEQERFEQEKNEQKSI